MTDTRRVSQLPVITVPKGTDEIYVVVDGASYRVSLEDILANVDGPAGKVVFDPTATDFESTDVQSVLEEIYTRLNTIATTPTLNIVEPVGTIYEVSAGVEDDNILILFDQTDPCEVQFFDTVDVGVTVNFRNKQAGQITVSYGLNTVTGAGQVTVDSSMVNSAYKESETVVVTAGNMTTI